MNLKSCVFASLALPMTLMLGCASPSTDDEIDEGGAASDLSASSSRASSPADCELESVQAALIEAISTWNNDGAAVGTSFEATSVTLEPGSEGRQGTFINTVGLSIHEAGRGSTLQTSTDVVMQKIGDRCYGPEEPSRERLASWGVGTDGNAAPCPLQSAAGALVKTIEAWNIDGAPIGTSFKVTKVALKPDSEGVQGTFTSTVSLEIFEAGRDSTLRTSTDILMQNFGDRCFEGGSY